MASDATPFANALVVPSMTGSSNGRNRRQIKPKKEPLALIMYCRHVHHARANRYQTLVHNAYSAGFFDDLQTVVLGQISCCRAPSGQKCNLGLRNVLLPLSPERT